MPNHDKAVLLMEEAPAAYLTTIGPGGIPRTRAMLNLRRPGDYPALVPFFREHAGDLAVFFTTNTSSEKVRQIRANPLVSVYYCRSREWRGLSLSGRIEVVEDAALKQYFWQDGWTMYYPGGAQDPDYALLRLMPDLALGYHKLERYEFVPG